MFNIPIVNNLIGSLSFAKIGLLAVNIALIIFLIVVFIQVSSLEKIFREIHDSSLLKALVILMLISAISLFLLGLVIL